MKIIFVLQFLLLFFEISLAQDTLYLSKDLKKTNKTDAAYTQIITPVENGFKEEKYNNAHILTENVMYDDATLKILSGHALYYSDKGKIDSEGDYVKNKKNGKWKYYFESGSISGVVSYNNGIITKEDYLQPNGQPQNDEKMANRPPSFKGGNDAMIKYLATNLKYPENLREDMHGKVMVNFTISREGHIINIYVSTSLNKDLDNEALRVVAAMPDWDPGIQFNRPINVHYLMPFKF
jgi:TonB family protein